jgi:hypothetical protein
LVILAKLRVTPDRASKFVMGAALKTARDCGGTVYVFHDQIAEFSSVQQIAPALAMGTVIAHEVGHLLLQPQGHSAEGLMRASWDASDWQRAAMGFLLFSSHDAATIRATTLKCRQQAAGMAFDPLPSLTPSQTLPQGTRAPGESHFTFA